MRISCPEEALGWSDGSGEIKQVFTAIHGEYSSSAIPSVIPWITRGHRLDAEPESGGAPAVSRPGKCPDLLHQTHHSHGQALRRTRRGKKMGSSCTRWDKILRMREGMRGKAKICGFHFHRVCGPDKFPFPTLPEVSNTTGLTFHLAVFHTGSCKPLWLEGIEGRIPCAGSHSSSSAGFGW